MGLQSNVEAEVVATDGLVVECRWICNRMEKSRECEGMFAAAGNYCHC